MSIFNVAGQDAREDYDFVGDSEKTGIEWSMITEENYALENFENFDPDNHDNNVRNFWKSKNGRKLTIYKKMLL